MLHTEFVIIFVQEPYQPWCQISGKNSRNRKENLTVIELTHTMTTTTTVNSRKNLQTHRAFQEAFREDFEYSDFF